jgi:hypothetical protein
MSNCTAKTTRGNFTFDIHCRGGSVSWHNAEADRCPSYWKFYALEIVLHLGRKAVLIRHGTFCLGYGGVGTFAGSSAAAGTAPATECHTGKAMHDCRAAFPAEFYRQWDVVAGRRAIF